MAVSYTQWIDYLFAKSRGTGTPFSGTFELTSRCNLDCRMCYIHKRQNDREAMKRELPAAVWLEIAAAAQKQGMLLLLLTGGEPLLRKDFKELYTGLRRLGILLSINTNGTLITQEMVDFFKADRPLRVNLTLYGASPETYERLCGDASAYDRAYRAVDMLLQAGIRVKLNYSATPENIADLPAVYAYARARGLVIQTASYMFPPIRACEMCEFSTDRLTPEESAQIKWEYELFRAGDNLAGLETRAEALLAGKPAPSPDSECQELPTEKIRCRAGDTTFWVTYAGEMRPCGMMSTPTVDVLSMGFAEAWKATGKARSEIMFPAKCTTCEKRNACELCPAVCYAETGSFTGVPEYLCRRTECSLARMEAWLKERKNRDESES